MSHTHTLPDGTKTSIDIVDPNSQDQHYHMVLSERTSSVMNADDHTHIFKGQATSSPIDEAEQNNSRPQVLQQNRFSPVLEVKQADRNGVPVGIVSGYIATWDIDRGDMFGVKDKFLPGAFRESIADHANRNRPVRLKDHHDRTIGAFPIQGVYEDSRGLFGTGEINLDVQQGREAFSLAKQGVLSDFSIGFMVEEAEMINGVRVISKAQIFEGSIVDEPMNPNANIVSVKSIMPYQDLPIAAKDADWDPSAALERIREFAETREFYSKAFIFSGKESEVDSHKLQIADIINGRLTVIPKAVFAAAEELKGLKEISSEERNESIKHLERYYAKMNMASPFCQKQYYVKDDVESWGRREFEEFLKKTGAMSNKAAKTLSSKLAIDEKKEDNSSVSAQDYSEILRSITELKEKIKTE